MRKAQKKDILDMIQTLHEAHEEIKNHIDRNNIVSAQDLLAQCQECAVSIGNAIETMEKEDCITIPYIQDYCDLVYQIYEALQNNTDSNANKIYKNLKKQLLRIENSVKNDIPVRKEVVFFPYKASMWDSLESVYLAAKEDPECDAYCVPIPYYDRNPDRSLGQMHYEGNEYPKNIEVIDWQSYNFEERKPDVIYIHNPYDDWNLVTCVHPRYFSSNLKKYTEKLVYIPYFVLQEIEPDDQGTIDQMKHFIWTPGVINADKVIVQSEKMKQIYVNEYLKAAQENGLQGNHLDRKYLEEKFLGLGSPKIDKVLNTKKEDLEIPKEWLKIIQKPDGSWKKIIFYNTSIAALLENNEKMLEKMKDVFSIFKENKDEVALLWRPHPLIKSTVSSMRPQLWVEYEKLVKWYKEEGWGIYDDSSDMDRAVVLSDAYYGDMSSLVPVYQQTGKMMMIQNALIYKKAKKSLNILESTDIVFTDTSIWILTDYANAVVEIDKETHFIKNIVYLPEECKIYLSVSFIIADNWLYLAPYSSENFWRINVITKQIEKIDINLTQAEKMYKRKFTIIFRYRDSLILVGNELDYFLVYNLRDGKIKKINGYKEELEKRKTAKDVFFTENYVVVDNNAYFPIRNSNSILTLDLEKETFNIFTLENINGGLYTIEYDKENFILTDGNDEEIVWNPLYGILINKKNNFICVRNKRYRTVEFCNGKWFYFGGFEGKIGIRRSSTSLQIEMVDFDYPEKKLFDGSFYTFKFVKKNNNQIFFQIRSTGQCYVLDTLSETIHEYSIKIPEKIEDILNKKIVKNNYQNYMKENKLVGLECLMERNR